MNNLRKSSAFLAAYTFVAAITFVYLFLATAIVPYWQGLSGEEVQTWFMIHFDRFSILMVPVHFISIITMITAYIMHRKERIPLNRIWLVALVTLLICQFFNFVVYGGNFNVALSSGTLDPSVALETLDQWGFWHNVRTLSVCISLFSLFAISILTNNSAVDE